MKACSRFDQAAEQWDANPARVELARSIGSAILSSITLRPDWRVIDYGAGTGLLTLNLRPHVASMLALDASNGMVRELSRKLTAARITNVEIRLWNLETQPYSESNFDMAVSSMTLHHVRDCPLVLTRLAATLKPGGWLAIADLDKEDGTFHGEANDVFHHGFDRKIIASWLDSAGLRNVAVRDGHLLKKTAADGATHSYGVFLAIGQKGTA